MKKIGGRTGHILVFTAVLLVISIIINNSTTVLKVIYPIKYKEYVFKHSQKNNIDPYLVFAIIKTESNFNPKAQSRKNAKGLMQITDETGKWAANKNKLENFKTEDLYNPEINILLGCWYIHWLMQQFNNDTDLVIAAYNGGNGNVNEWLKDKKFSSSGTSLEKIPFKETDNFVKKVKKYHDVYKGLYVKEF
ncbi:MAG: lytic transglycosylase domain-containing protein [Clostridiales bacterium]|nr:lytic transglycosylase domain-containing protein [Eubacteriales bacterium]MDH7565296.1 lytic transglycosylase domain-containing protein [Clostridiales bacterium]